MARPPPLILLFLLGLRALGGRPCGRIGPIGCWRCEGGNCTQCWQGWASYGRDCVRCGAGGHCHQAGCASGYLAVPRRGERGGGKSSCAACADNCAECREAGAGKCDKGMCRPGFAVDAHGRCSPCPVGCEECLELGQCQVCQRQYGLLAGHCHKCTPWCKNCSGTPTSGNASLACDADGCFRRFGRSSAGHCERCAPHCSRCSQRGPGRCDGPEHCGSRRLGGAWTLQANGTCARCPENCQRCDRAGPGRCDACSPGFGPAKDGGCGRCPAGCAACNRSAESCERCRAPLQLAPNGSCFACPPSCARCDAPTACRRCRPGFGKGKAGGCTRCGILCRRCDADAEECEECELGFGPAANGRCRHCPANCEACSNSGSCDRCVADHVPAPEGGGCVPGDVRLAEGEVRSPGGNGSVLVLPVLAVQNDEQCLRLLDVEKGQLLDVDGRAAPSLCLPWDHTVGLACSFDSHRGLFYLAEGPLLRQLDLDSMKQVAAMRLEADLLQVASDPSLPELVAVLRGVRVASVAPNGALGFWRGAFDAGFGHNELAVWGGRALLPSRSSAVLRELQRAGPSLSVEAGFVKPLLAVRFDGETGRLYGIGVDSELRMPHEPEPFSLYEILGPLETEGPEWGRLSLRFRCRLPELYRLLEGDRGSYSFLARGKLYVVAAASPHHLRDRLFSVDVRSCEQRLLNWSLHAALGGDWTCVADRAAAFEEGRLRPLEKLPPPQAVDYLPDGRAPPGVGCLRPLNPGPFAALGELSRRAFENCTEADECAVAEGVRENLLTTCSEGAGGQVCTLLVVSGTFVREASLCVPLACRGAQEQFAADEGLKQRWCPNGSSGSSTCRLQLKCEDVPTSSTSTTMMPPGEGPEEVLRQGLQSLLEGQPQLQEALETLNWSTALQHIDAWTPPSFPVDSGQDTDNDKDEDDVTSDEEEATTSTPPSSVRRSSTTVFLADEDAGTGEQGLPRELPEPASGGSGRLWAAVLLLPPLALLPLLLLLRRNRALRARSVELPREGLLG